MARTGVKSFNWTVGCGTYGQLISPAGGEQLIETLRFDEREATVVLLASGERMLVRWSQKRYVLREMSAEAACESVGIPAPPRIRVAGEWRRVDPFHSERHCSTRFRALVALITHRRLPCRYSLLHFAAGEPAGDWEGPCIEDPEQTAGNVAERLARAQDLSLSEALRAELLADALIATKDEREAQALLERAGWSAVLGDLDEALVGFSGLPAPLPLTTAVTSQLSLFGLAEEKQ